jgi:hypothetical protein
MGGKLNKNRRAKENGDYIIKPVAGFLMTGKKAGLKNSFC